MIGQHLLRFIYKKKPSPNSILYRDVIKFIDDIDGDVLDLGGGPGYLHLYLKQKTYYVVQDIDYVLLSYGDMDIDRVQAAAEERVFRADSFDNIIIHDALHHFRDIDKTIDNVVSLARGRIWIFEIELGSPTGKLIKVFEKLLGFPGNLFRSAYLSRAIKNRYSHLGIELVKMGRFRYLLKVYCQPHS